MYDVIRTFGADYILFDLIFLAIFIGLLLKFNKRIPLLTFVLGGLGINLLVDWGIWLNTGIREVILPLNWNVFWFFFWFSLSYGVEYAYVFLMFEKKSNKLGWTLLVFGGWISIAFLSQLIPLNDATITTIRHMSNLRNLRIFLVLIGYALLFILKYDWKKITYLFFIGFLIHFMMEFSLFISGIRPGSFLILFENSLIEFNMGVPFFYLLYDKYLKNKFKH
jgi:hypothetical protein